MFRNGGLANRSRSFLSYGIPVLFVILYIAIANAQAPVQVCHFPPGNPTNSHTITVLPDGLAAHLKHGDFIGSCDCPCWTTEELKRVAMTCGVCKTESEDWVYAQAIFGTSGQGCGGMVVAETGIEGYVPARCFWNADVDSVWDRVILISATQWEACYRTLYAELVDRGYCPP